MYGRITRRQALRGLMAAAGAALAGCQPSEPVALRMPTPTLGRDCPRGENLPPATWPDRHEPASPVRPSASGAEPGWSVRPGRVWKYIVIHHSATERGSAESFDRAHRARGWDSLGYHFVIGNGHGQTDGRVVVGQRWGKQKHGAHTGGTPGNEYNEHGIGICLVGDFSGKTPSRAQLASLDRLVRFLSKTYHVPPQNIIGHQDAPGAETNCPGRTLYGYIYHSLRPDIQRMHLADAR